MSNRKTTLRGFSLVEVMIAAALLGLIGAGSLTAIQFAAAESGRTRARTIGSSEAQTTIDRILALGAIASSSASLVTTNAQADAMLCSLLQAPGGPLAGGTVTVNTCPTLTVTDIPVANSTLKRAVIVTNEPIGAPPGLRIRVRVSGGALPPPGFIEVISHIRK